MKKSILTFLFVIGFAFFAKAQDISPNAIGLRLGNNNGFGTEITFQKSIRNNNRIEANLGWRNSALKLTALYQWVMPIDRSGLNWYVGLGGGAGSVNGLIIYGAADLGIEYQFDELPVQISLDIRPEIGGKDLSGQNIRTDLGLSVRYTF